MTSTDLKNEIESAWEAASPLPPMSVAYDESGAHLECAQVSRYFRGKHWKACTTVHLDYSGDSSACLRFMAPDAFRYYLAAYLMVAIDHAATADLAGQAAVAALEPTNIPELQSWQQELFSGFTLAQRAALLRFLTFMVEHHDTGYTIGDPKAALSYWQRAA